MTAMIAPWVFDHPGFFLRRGLRRFFFPGLPASDRDLGDSRLALRFVLRIEAGGFRFRVAVLFFGFRFRVAVLFLGLLLRLADDRFGFFFVFFAVFFAIGFLFFFFVRGVPGFSTLTRKPIR
jgi:hypothetical protein